jgi:hypothetical protein
MRRISAISALVPTTATCRRRSPWATVSVPITMGAMRSMPRSPRRSARTSSRVRSFGTPPRPGMPPVVWLRPGTTITMLLPIAANSPVT